MNATPQNFCFALRSVRIQEYNFNKGSLLKLLFVVFAITILTGCVTKNDAGVRLYKKPDLTKVTPGTPINKVAGLKKPIKKEVFTKGDLKGAEAWLFEWDLPNDDVNNRMFTSVIVKDGIILGYAEETAEKWSKQPELYKAAKKLSAGENFVGHMAKAAYYERAAGMLANYNATRPRYDPVQSASAMFANSYQPWKSSGTVNYGTIGNGISTSSQIAANRSPQNLTAWRMGNTLQMSDGSSVRQVGNTLWNSDGTSTTKVGNTYRHSDGTITTQHGNMFQHSDGTITTKYFNRYQNSDGSSVTVYGD